MCAVWFSFFFVHHYSNILVSAAMLPCFHVTTTEEKKPRWSLLQTGLEVKIMCRPAASTKGQGGIPGAESRASARRPAFFFWWLCTVQQPLYCHCWFAPVIPDGTADPGAAVPSLLWKPWSYLTPLCRQVPCHPAKPHWLPVQKGPPVLMQMGGVSGGQWEKHFHLPHHFSFPFFPSPLSCSQRLRFTI